MSENNPTRDLDESTQGLSAVEMLRLVLTDVRDMKSSLTNIESRLIVVENGLSTLQSTVDDRLKDTRPIWSMINDRTERIEEMLSQMKDQMRELAYSDLEMKGQQSRLSQRMSDLENRVTGD
jgi:DNA repair ATPase RecN